MGPAGDARVAIVGATGAVGTQLTELIAARGFPHSELKLFAGESSADRNLEISGEELLIEPLKNPEELDDFDIVFLAVPAIDAAKIVAKCPRPVIVDLSAASRPHPRAVGRAEHKILIVAPGLTSSEEIERLRGRKIFAPPHPAAHALAACLKALDLKEEFVSATAMLGASTAGRDMVSDTVQQSADLLNARLDLDENEIQRGFNLFVGEDEREAAFLIGLQAAILLNRLNPPISIPVQAVAVPVLHGSALTVQIQRAGGVGDAKDHLRAAPGLLLADDDRPLAVIDAAGQEAIIVSVESRPSSLALWCVFDNARLAALDALWIAETLVSAGTMAS
ncbi:MAG TPA: Asd/ArgC dimerization domain-containing protein [Candidatus Binataceae bacterium]|nr:Asd/ArgC dimerization domain-containing protein [Candidatus Binataceae bacterium]